MVAVIGLALALISVPGEGLDASVIRQEVWAFVSRRRERAPAEAGRLLAIGAAGLLALLYPKLALSVAAVGGGALMLMLSLVGWRKLAQKGLPAEIRGTRDEVHIAPVAWAGIRIVGLLVVGVVGAAILLRIRPPVEPVEPVMVRVRSCNGAVELCARPFNKVVFPGAHNAMGSAMNPKWLFPNQDLDIQLLLDRGVRAFLIDPYRGNVIGDKVKTDFDAVPYAKAKTANVIGNEAWAAGMRMRDQLTGELGRAACISVTGIASSGPFRSYRSCAPSPSSSGRTPARS